MLFLVSSRLRLDSKIKYYDSNKFIYDIIGITTYVRSRRLFELSDNKMATTTKMYALGWG